jgi:hypothetical protein
MANQYEVSISPTTADMSLTVTFTITVLNNGPQLGPSPRAADEVPPLTNSVNIRIPYGDIDGALTPSVNDVEGTPLTQGWDCGKRQTSSGWIFVFWPLSGTQFPVGAQAQMTLPLVISTKASGPATVKVNTTLGGADEDQQITVTKTYPPLAVSLSAEPLYVGALQRVKLNWRATGASQVQITPNVGTFDAPNRFLWNGTTTALPSQTTPQTTFQAIASTGDQRTESNQITVYLKPPTASLQVSTNGPIDASDGNGKWTNVQASWTTQYAIGAKLSDGSTITPVALQNDNYPLTPGKSLVGSSNKVTEQLIATGYSTPATSTQTITFNPARILYFKYANPDLTGMTFRAMGSTNGGGAVTQPVPGGPWIYTVQGPGGPLVQYLGKTDPHTQIMYFNADPPNVAPNATVTLSWISNNATSLLLKPGDVPLTVVPNFGVGTCQVKPAATTDYVIVAVGASSTVTSTLTVTVT